MTVYIGSMIMRGPWAKLPPNTFLINATSMQKTDSPFRRDFSPMSPVEGKYKGFYCFENYWHAHKVYDYLNHLNNPTERDAYVQWWRNLNTGKRRHPLTKKPPVYAIYEDNIIRGYINSRKNIYVPQWGWRIKDEIDNMGLLPHIIDVILNLEVPLDWRLRNLFLNPPGPIL